MERFREKMKEVMKNYKSEKQAQLDWDMEEMRKNEARELEEEAKLKERLKEI